MAHQTIISNAAAIVICNALKALVDNGSVLRIYDGVMPTDLEPALTTQNLLVEMALPFPAFGAAADGTGKASASLTSVISAAPTAAGTATFFRVLNSSGVPVWQGTVGMLGCDLNLSSTNILLGVSVRINSWTLSISENQTVCP